MMNREQKIVLAGALTGIVSMLLGTWLVYELLPGPENVATAAERVGYAAPWLALAALPLFAMVAAVGNARFMSEANRPDAWGRGQDDDRQRPGGGRHHAALLLFVAAAIIFAIARIVFWIGYRIHPLYRRPASPRPPI